MPPKSTRKRKPTTRSAAKPPSVRVRMYRSGLGDSFLITFDPGGQEKHLLIDCGSLGATTTGVKLSEVVADIRKTTKDHIHLLIATHEHQDHVCGFRNCMKDFKEIMVDQIWLAWTENPRDENAIKIAKYKNDLGMALAYASRELLKHGSQNKESANLGASLQSILGFALEPDEPLGASGLKKTIQEAMEFVRTGLGPEAQYKTPGGASLEEDWLPGFRFYILGPPTAKEVLRDLGEHDSDHLYHFTTGLGYNTDGSPLTPEEQERYMPFEAGLRLPTTSSMAADLFSKYSKPEDQWRNIDHDWLYQAEHLAIQLDNLTNNTSLALAIERISDGKVLLFPADAQQGNWLSWHAAGMKWTVQKGKKTLEKSADQLLAQTVFYKVGHHGSHNATARTLGLEMMHQEQDLVAFIPVDRAVALGRNPKNKWQMPARPLYRRLLEKCHGRVVRSDIGWADDAKNAKNKATEKEFIGLANTDSWTQWKQSQQQAIDHNLVQENKLYFDYLLH